MEYLDFEVSVDPPQAGEYEVRVRAPSGEPRAKIRFPFSQDELTEQLAAFQGALERARSARDVVVTDNGSPVMSREVAERFGRTLFTTLITGKVLVAWRTSGTLARREGRGLRLQLRLQAPEMAALPWELMFDPDDETFVCLNPSTPLVRYPELDQPREPLGVKLPLRVLGMIASPSSLPRLDKEAERSRIEQALAGLRQDGHIELSWVKGGTYRDLQAALREGPWHVLHFIGHGGFQAEGQSGEGVLALEPSEDSRGPAHLVPADRVGDLLCGHPSLRLVLLNSCLGARGSAADVFSSTASTLIRRGIPALIAMQHEISDRAAVVFAQAFYTSLSAGTPVDRAVNEARSAISALNRDSLEWGTPVLLMRSPDGMLFSPRAEDEEDSRPPIAPLPPRRSLPWRAVAGAAGAPLLLIGALALVRMPTAEMALDADVTQVGIRLPAPRSISDLEVSSAGISGIGMVEIPRRGPIATDRALLSVTSDSWANGRLALDLTAPLPAGTQVALSTFGDSGSYELTLSDSVPSLTATATGLVRILVPAEVDEQFDFPAPAIVRLVPERGVVRLELTPTAPGRGPFSQALPADGLDLIQVYRFESADGTELREVSTIRSGRLSITGGDRLSLATGDQLRFRGVQGEIRQLSLAGNHLALSVHARVEGLSMGAASSRRDLMPSVLGWAASLYPRWLAGLGASYLLVVGIVTALLLRRNGAGPVKRRSAMTHRSAVIGMLMLALASRAGAQEIHRASSEATALVVKVSSYFEDELEIGSGVIVGMSADRVYIVTARHVVRRQEPASRVYVTLAGAPGDSIAAGLSDSVRADLDVAVLTIPRGSPGVNRLAFDRLGVAEKLRFGDPVSPMGCPQGVCWGVPVPADRVVGIDAQGVIFQSGFVKAGSSGGALFNEYWEVVGIVTEDAPPRANAVPIDQALALVRTWGYPVALRRPKVPRSGYGLHIGGIWLTRIGGTEDSIGDKSRVPSGRIVATRRGDTYGLTWHLSGLRLAPRNLAVTAAMGGLGVDFRYGPFLVQPFVEVGAGRVEGRFDGGGYYVTPSDGGSDYVPLWRQEKQDGLGFGGGMSLLVLVAPHVSLEGLAGHWSFNVPDSLPGLPNLFVGSGLRLGF